MTGDIHSTTNLEHKKNRNQHEQPIDPLLRWKSVQPLVGICRSHAHQLIAEGKFPAPIKLVEGGRASAWQESKIREWVEGRIASSTSSDSAT